VTIVVMLNECEHIKALDKMIFVSETLKSFFLHPSCSFFCTFFISYVCFKRASILLEWMAYVCVCVCVYWEGKGWRRKKRRRLACRQFVLKIASFFTHSILPALLCWWILNYEQQVEYHACLYECTHRYRERDGTAYWMKM
jgi:hypothetical protein